jgi:hypothetical protein
MESNEQILRRLLWLRHGCPKEDLYGGDGDMICNNCLLDFNHDPLIFIEQSLMRQVTNQNDYAFMRAVLDDILGSIRLDYIKYNSHSVRKYISKRLEPLIMKFLPCEKE